MSSVKWNCQNISIFFHNAVWPTKKWRERGSSMRKLRDNSLLTAAGKFEDRTSYTSDFVPKDMSKRQVWVLCVHWKPYFICMIWNKNICGCLSVYVCFCLCFYIWKLEKRPILQKMHSSVNIDNVSFWLPILPFLYK